MCQRKKRVRTSVYRFALSRPLLTYMHDDDDDIRSLPIRSSYIDLLAAYSGTRVIIPRMRSGG
ncbi:MAG: hypothetical protein P4L69_04270 [Desulfosporosinus sp.]|nr:hypothetical protein [Desulfosporosinus sp.]